MVCGPGSAASHTIRSPFRATSGLVSVYVSTSGTPSRIIVVLILADIGEPLQSGAILNQRRVIEWIWNPAPNIRGKIVPQHSRPPRFGVLLPPSYLQRPYRLVLEFLMAFDCLIEAKKALCEQNSQNL